MTEIETHETFVTHTQSFFMSAQSFLRICFRAAFTLLNMLMHELCRRACDRQFRDLDGGRPANDAPQNMVLLKTEISAKTLGRRNVRSHFLEGSYYTPHYSLDGLRRSLKLTQSVHCGKTDARVLLGVLKFWITARLEQTMFLLAPPEVQRIGRSIFRSLEMISAASRHLRGLSQ